MVGPGVPVRQPLRFLEYLDRGRSSSIRPGGPIIAKEAQHDIVADRREICVPSSAQDERSMAVIDGAQSADHGLDVIGCREGVPIEEEQPPAAGLRRTQVTGRSRPKTLVDLAHCGTGIM